MRTSTCFIIWVAAAALFIAGCSSTSLSFRDDGKVDDATADTGARLGANEQTAGNAAEELADEEAPVDTPADADDDPDQDETSDTDSEADDGFDDGFGLGDAEQLEALLTDCEGGSDPACDILFQLSAFDSVEEVAALTCGGRSEVEVLFCTKGIDGLSNDLSFDPTSDGLADLVSDCEDGGDMTACDFLYYRSPIDSPFEEIGATCGGRAAVAVPDCRTLLAESTNG